MILKVVRVVAVLLFAAPCVVEAQQTGNVYRIAFLSIGSASVQSYRLEALRAGLRDLGYVEGKNIVIELKWAGGKYDP